MEKCGRDECFVCNTSKGKCEKNGIGYEICCQTCLRDGRKTVYGGESGRNAFTRGAEHFSAPRLEDKIVNHGNTV